MLTYQDETGSEVKTAQFLRNRGSCCKTACRHCPYGYTLKHKGLQFTDYSHQQRTLAEQLIQHYNRESQAGEGLAASLLAEGITQRQPTLALKDLPPEALKLVLLKGRVIGLIVISKVQVKHLFLNQHYREQGIDIPTVESFYF